MDLNILKSLDSGSGSTIEDYKFLYGFVSLVRPKRIFEVGTHFGVSAIAMAAALKDEGLNSKVISVDIDEKCLQIAKEQIEQVGLSQYVELIHGDSSVAKCYVGFDVAFIDGDHSYEACKKDFENLKNKTTYILLHDSVISEVSMLVREISKSPELEVINLSFGNVGASWSFNKVVYCSFPGIAIVKRLKQ